MSNHLSCNITCHDGFYVWEYGYRKKHYYAVKLNESRYFSIKFGNSKQIEFFNMWKSRILLSAGGKFIYQLNTQFYFIFFVGIFKYNIFAFAPIHLFIIFVLPHYFCF